ncbi:YqhA family protein [Roseomonas sp. CAU 1739]|uniref:YqhA family protein n=1 Tax=Roseomonas sp. CAU 1739 TaxID=3140364 RepID=UPI00325BC9DD
MRPILAKFILFNRWLAAIFLLGLTVALALFAARFVMKIVKFGAGVFSSPEDQALLDLLHLLDWTLVASLVVMVILASWDSLVSPSTRPAGRAGCRGSASSTRATSR